MSGGDVQVSVQKARRRGEPLLMLIAVAAVWAGGRSVFWEAPRFIGPAKPTGARKVERSATPLAVPATAPVLGAPAVPFAPILNRRARVAVELETEGAKAGRLATGVSGTMRPGGGADAAGEVFALAPSVALAAAAGEGAAVSRSANPVAHQMLWMAAMANLPLPTTFEARQENDPKVLLTVRGRPKRWLFGLLPQTRGGLVGLRNADGSRWSGDGWMLARRGGDSVASGGNGAFAPSYGANQIGAVLRYRLGAASGHRLTAYVRGYGAMNGSGEKEAAFGLSARPFSALPVAALVEMRVSRFADGATHLRPAVSVVSEAAPVALGRGIELETYGQAGYVGGEAATGFVDGQARVEKVVTGLRLGASGQGDLRVGLGAWGGAQDKVGRLDMGPSLRLTMSNGHAGARLALDWRMRVEGNAMPSSGPALTLSAGF